VDIAENKHFTLNHDDSLLVPKGSR